MTDQESHRKMADRRSVYPDAPEDQLVGRHVGSADSLDYMVERIRTEIEELAEHLDNGVDDLNYDFQVDMFVPDDYHEKNDAEDN